MGSEGPGSQATQLTLQDLQLSPAAGPVGTLLSITSAGGRFRTADRVRIGALDVTPLSRSSTLLVVEVPALPRGAAQVSLLRDGATVGPLPFEVRDGQVYYLSPRGDDDDDGTRAAPFRTFDVASLRRRPGDVIYARGGSYEGRYTIRATGTAAAPITVTVHPGESAVIEGPALREGENSDALSLYGAYVTVSGLRVTNQNNPGRAIAIDASARHITVERCTAFGARGQGIGVSGNDNLIERNHVYDNGVHDAHDHGIYVEGGRNVVRDNSVHDNWAFGIHLYDGRGRGGGGNVVEYNYVYRNGLGTYRSSPARLTSGIVVADGHPDTIVRRNRVCANARYGILLISGQVRAAITENVTCYNGQGGIFLPYPGAGDTVFDNVSYNDDGFALSLAPGARSDRNTFFDRSGALVFQYREVDMDLAAYRARSGQDAASVVTDPGFRDVAADGFRTEDADRYDFCTSRIPALCAPR